MRRALFAIAALVLLAGLAAISSDQTRQPVALTTDTLPAEPLTPYSPDALDTTTTTLPPTTVTTSKPVEPPRDAYAAEPHVVIGSIEIPKLGLAVPLNEGISLHSIDRGPSHWPGTAMPGRVGNVVVAGHRVTKTRPFRHIDTLVPGDEIIFVFEGMRIVYHVTGHEVVTPDATWIVDQTPEKTATLFACHPPGSARYRYVVRAAFASSTPV